MSRILYIGLLFAGLFTAAQPPVLYVPPAQIPSEYQFNRDAELARIAGDAADRFSPELRNEYADLVLSYHQMMLRGGAICMGLDHIEKYVQRLVDTICVVAAIEKPFRVFIMYDESVNASAYDNGFIYVNIGMLAAAEDEGALVSVLGHEISHAIHDDGKATFAARKKKQKGQTEAGKLISAGHSSRVLESRADNEGFGWAQQLGFDVSGCRSYLNRFETDYQWYRSQYGYQDAKWEIALDRTGKDHDVHPDSLEWMVMDHPQNAERLARLQSACVASGGRKFAVDSVLFARIHREAIYEQLRISFNDADLRSCLRIALYYHLVDRNDPAFLYYLCEGSRRFLMSEPALAGAGFLTDESKDKRFAGRKGILHAPAYLLDDPTFINTIANDSIYGARKKPFETYEEAYRWFFPRAVPALPELHFGHALFDLFRLKNKSAEDHLRSYIASGDKKWINLANALLENPNTLNEWSPPQSDLIFLQDVEYYRYRKDNVTYDRDKSREATVKFRKFVDGHLGFTRTPSLFVAGSDSFSRQLFYQSLLKRLEKFKPAKEAGIENRESSVRDAQYWRSREVSEPNDPEVIQRRKNFFAVNPEYYEDFAGKRTGALVFIKPYVFKVPARGEYVFCEMMYFDPVNRKYVYSEQQVFVKFRGMKVRSLLRDFKISCGVGKQGAAQ